MTTTKEQRDESDGIEDIRAAFPWLYEETEPDLELLYNATCDISARPGASYTGDDIRKALRRVRSRVGHLAVVATGRKEAEEKIATARNALTRHLHTACCGVDDSNEHFDCDACEALHALGHTFGVEPAGTHHEAMMRVGHYRAGREEVERLRAKVEAADWLWTVANARQAGDGRRHRDLEEALAAYRSAP